MDKLSAAKDSAYYDFAALDELRSAKPDDQSALKAAAKQFESIFTQMLLTSMRKASEVLESDSPFNSQSTKFYRDMHDKQMVSNIAETGGLGLADMIVEQLSGNNPNFTPASVLRPDSGLDGMGRVYKAQTSGQDKARASNEASEATAEKSAMFDSPESFVKSLLPVAQKVLQNSPLSPVMVVAQAALETGWGKKVINKGDGSSSFNLFGIKADERWQGDKAKVQTVEFRDGVARKENAFFRAYHSLEQGLKDYVDFISSNERYSQAVENAQDPQQYFKSLQSAGYATDPQYADKVLNILNSGVFEQIKE